MESQQDKNGMGREWFSVWLPKLAAARAEGCRAMEDRIEEGEVVSGVPDVGWLDEVRGELSLVTSSLLDPSAAGVRASLPHLERAVAVFKSRLGPESPLAGVKPAVQALEFELKQATRLFENAYLLQAGWAAEAGLNVDGTPQKVFYGRNGELMAGLALRDDPAAWEG